MLPFVAKAVGFFSRFAFKPIKYFIDDNFREKVTPKPGSVVYSDLFVAVEHSGIYDDDGRIVNIVVDGFAESEVKYSDAMDFTSKSVMGQKIYVSCDEYGAVGGQKVANGAKKHIGERAFYGLVINNCHQFSQKCVNYSNGEYEKGFIERLTSISTSIEPTIASLKSAARKKLGATKWRLWDWQNDEQREPEPDWDDIQDALKNQPLNPQSIAQIRQEREELREYEEQISNEHIPEHIRKRLAAYGKTIDEIDAKYEEAKEFLASCPGGGFSYEDLRAMDDDFSALAKEMKSNSKIKDLARKMGRGYISEERKRHKQVAKRSQSEIYGVHRSNDIMRLLPAELVNLEDETLETLFYARLLEKNLTTYELGGITLHSIEEKEEISKKTGPVVACLDTSASMEGAAMLKAKALLLVICGILQTERRSLSVLLFGSSGQIKELSITSERDSAKLLSFLREGFGGGTDFETPLKHAFGIIESKKSYKKADVLMITDGDCGLSADFVKTVKSKKIALECSVYTVLCSGERIKDEFSDEIIAI